MTKGQPHVCVGLYSSYRKFPGQIDRSIDDMYGLTSTRFVAVSHRVLTNSATFLPGESWPGSLVLIDSPVSYGPERLPKPFYGYCNSAGLFGEKGGPSTD